MDMYYRTTNIEPIVVYETEIIIYYIILDLYL